jgi:hypothetical protein
MSRRFHQGRIRQVSLEDFGGDSTGTDPSDDALALALETELPVSIPPGTWLFNATHPLLADGQTVLGVGSQTIIKPSGNFNFLTISGGLIGCEIGNFHYDGALQSGGYIVYASNHGRTIIRNIKSTSPFDGFYSEQVNQLTFKDLWLQGFRGTMMFNLFGSPALRSDVIEFRNVTASADQSVAAASRAVGVNWDGNIHTVSCTGLKIITPRKGIWTQNTSGGTFPATTPAFGRLVDVQVDYPEEEAIRAEEYWDFKVVAPYTNNSVSECGQYWGANGALAQVIGAQVQGNAKEGIVNLGADNTFTSCETVLNSLSSVGLYDGIRNAGARGKFIGCHSGLRISTGEVQRYGFNNDSGATATAWTGGYLGGVREPWNDADTTIETLTAAGSRLSVVNGLLMGSAAGYGARLTGNVGGGAISTVTVNSGGKFYAGTPGVFAFDPAGTGSGFSATATIVAGVITAIAVSNAGSGYSAGTIVYVVAASTEPSIWPYSTATNVGTHISGQGTGGVTLDAGTGRVASFAGVASSVNYLEFTPNIVNNAPLLTSAGSDAAISIGYVAKGSGSHLFTSGNGFSLITAAAASSVNYVTVLGQAAGSHPIVAAAGSTTDLNLRLLPQGAGGVDINGPATAGAAGASLGYATILYNGAPVKIQIFALA